MSIRNYVNVAAFGAALGLAALVNSAQAHVNQAGQQIKCEDKVVIAQPVPDDIMVYFTGTVDRGTNSIKSVDTEVVYGNGRVVPVMLPEDVSDMVKLYLAEKIVYGRKGCLIEYADP